MRSSLPVLTAILFAAPLSAQSTPPCSSIASVAYLFQAYECEFAGITFNVSNQGFTSDAFVPLGVDYGFLPPDYGITWTRIGNKITMAWSPTHSAGFGTISADPNAISLAQLRGSTPNTNGVEVLTNQAFDFTATSSFGASYVKRVVYDYSAVSVAARDATVRWAGGGGVNGSFAGLDYVDAGQGLVATRNFGSAHILSQSVWEFLGSQVSSPNLTFSGSSFISGGVGISPGEENVYVDRLASVSGGWSVTVEVTPEPSTWVLMATGFVVIGLVAWRRRTK